MGLTSLEGKYGIGKDRPQNQHLIKDCLTSIQTHGRSTNEIDLFVIKRLIPDTLPRQGPSNVYPTIYGFMEK